VNIVAVFCQFGPRQVSSCQPTIKLYVSSTALKIVFNWCIIYNTDWDAGRLHLRRHFSSLFSSTRDDLGSCPPGVKWFNKTFLSSPMPLIN